MKLYALVFIHFGLVACATPKSSHLNYDDTKKITGAIETDNLLALKEIFAKIPTDPQKRSENDQGLLNQALQMTALAEQNAMSRWETISPLKVLSQNITR